MTNELLKTNEIKGMIYEIRGKYVILDSDLAKVYECTNGTKDINKAVKRNIERFPEDFYFQLTEKEINDLRFQFGTANVGSSMSRTRPFAFTEQGAIMLSSVLRTNKAALISVNIMRAFIAMRNFISKNAEVFNRLTKLEYGYLEHDIKINQILDEMHPKEFDGKVFFDGQIYDAYSLLIDIIRKAKQNIIIIDNYVDKTILDILMYKAEKVNAEIYTKNIKTKLDIDKFNLQYSNVTINKIDRFHDRFIIIDDKIIYLVGASLKDLGKKCFGIVKIDSKNIDIIKNKIRGVQNVK